MHSDGSTESIWDGEIADMAWDESTARFRIPSRLGEALERITPNITCGTSCPHMLGDATCGVDLTGNGPTGLAHQITASVLSVDGRDIRVDLVSMDRNGDWAENGTIELVGAGETMTVFQQLSLTPGVNAQARLTMQAPIYGLQVGSAVKITVGCDGHVQTCVEKFDNVQRFGGYPYMPRVNHFMNRKVT
jgi:uncharacterized phage protein (TIGR02218 family)